MCVPKKIRPSDFKFEAGVKYALVFSFENSKAKSNPADKCELQPDGSLKIVAAEQLAINNTEVDTDLNVHL